jgi:hypothetical protein
MAVRGKQSPNLPAVPSGLDSQTTAFLNAVKELLETMQGKRRNTALQAVVTFEDLQNLGLKVSQKGVGTDAEYDFSRIVRGDNVPNPPRDLAVKSSVVSNKLTWTNPTAGATAISHVEVWCGFGSQSISDAIRVGVATFPNEEFVHSGLNTRASHTYWIRTVDWSGNYSPWEPSSGGLVMPADSSETINDLLARLTDDTSYETVHRVIADSFQVLQPSAGLSDPVPVFVVGTVDGETAVGINGNLFVDGAILAKHLDGDIINGAFLSASAQIQLGAGGLLRMEEGAKLFAGDGNFLLDTTGVTRLMMGEDGALDVLGGVAVGKDYTKYTGVDIEFYRWMEGEHRLFKSLKRVDTGWAENGSTVPLDGFWESAPQIHLSPRNMMCFAKSSPTVDQALNMEVTAVELQPGHTNKYQFTANARLVIAAGVSDFPVGLSGSVSTDTGTAQTATYTTPAYCTGAVIGYKIKAVKPTGLVNQFQRRSVVLKVYVDGVQAASRTISVGETVEYLTGTINVTGLTSSGTGHTIYLTAVASDYTGTFMVGDVVYDYQSTSDSSTYNEYGNSPESFSPPSPGSPGAGWEFLSYQVSFALSDGGNVSVGGNSGSGSSGSFTTYSLSPATFNGPYGCVTDPYSGEQVCSYTGTYLTSVLVTAYWRKPQTSTDSIDTEVVFDTASVTLAGANLLAEGTVNYMAMENN